MGADIVHKYKPGHYNLLTMNLNFNQFPPLQIDYKSSFYFCNPTPMPATFSSPVLANAQLIHDLATNNRLDKALASLQDEPALLDLQKFFKLNDPTDAILIAWFLVNG
jgi:hypothetical protein